MNWFVKNLVFSALAVIMVQLRTINASPYPENEYLAMRAHHLRTQINAMKIMKNAKLKEICFNVTGDNDAFANVESAQERTETCINLIVNEAIINSMHSSSTVYYDSVSPEDKIKATGKAICTKKQSIVQCQRDYNKVLMSCIDAKGKKKLEKAAKGFETLVSYICNNNAEVVESFTENGGVECFSRNKHGIVVCATDLSDDVASFVNPMSLTTAIVDESRSCKTAATFFNCFVDEMKKCTNQIPANIFKNLFEQIVAMECSPERK